MVAVLVAGGLSFATLASAQDPAQQPAAPAPAAPAQPAAPQPNPFMFSSDAAMLTFSGTVSGCSVPACTANVCTTTCPNAAPYGANMKVMDPEGNMDTFMFTIDICDETGMAP